jgi:hypothetical protein
MLILFSLNLQVIKTRRVLLEKERNQRMQNETQAPGEKRRLAFLDILLHGAFESSGMTDEDIKNQVDTFMFGVRA